MCLLMLGGGVWVHPRGPEVPGAGTERALGLAHKLASQYSRLIGYDTLTTHII